MPKKKGGNNDESSHVEVQEVKKGFGEKYLSQLLLGILTSMTVGGLFQLQQTMTQTQLTKREFAYVNKELDTIRGMITTMQNDIKTVGLDRWTRDDHIRYSTTIKKDIDDLNNKINNIYVRIEGIRNKALRN